MDLIFSFSLFYNVESLNFEIEDIKALINKVVKENLDKVKAVYEDLKGYERMRELLKEIVEYYIDEVYFNNRFTYVEIPQRYWSKVYSIAFLYINAEDCRELAYKIYNSEDFILIAEGKDNTYLLMAKYMIGTNHILVVKIVFP